jgi:hypothetical protein
VSVLSVAETERKLAVALRFRLGMRTGVGVKSWPTGSAKRLSLSSERR